jgi:(p)ppGpp synthase/HD superfamily hydrolase
MHAAAEMGTAAHNSYKGGFKEDPGAADDLADLVTAANAAAEERFGSFTEAGWCKFKLVSNSPGVSYCN